jgi:hypothetical protein
MAKDRFDINGNELNIGDMIVIWDSRAGISYRYPLHGIINGFRDGGGDRKTTVVADFISGKNSDPEDTVAQGFFPKRCKKIMLHSVKDHEFVYGKIQVTW